MRLTFVDLETTGGSPVENHITEVGIVEVDLDPHDARRPPLALREWSTLVCPDEPIPGFIEGLTGITNAMVADAPRFDAVADEILVRLEGRLFVAHNARFDHGFLKKAFRRLGRPFRPAVLCTVRLSRKLYPGYARHGLDALIERHRLVAENRHRALGDARLLWQLWQRLHDALPHDRIAAAVDQLTARPSLPRHLDPDVLDALPGTAGVYLFYGDPEPGAAAAQDKPLYIGKAKNLRQRVMQHFAGDHLSAREMEISQQLRRIEWIETGGGTGRDLGARLLESVLVKRLAPAYNRQLRGQNDTCAWRLVVDARSRRAWLGIARPDDLFFTTDRDLYGPFRNRRQAGNVLRALADEHGLCAVLLGLEKRRGAAPCFGYQVRRCRGACVGVEPIEAHTTRLLDALAPLAMRPWPHAGTATFREGHRTHRVDDWAYVGMSSADDDATRDIRFDGAFDIDSYHILRRNIDALSP